MLCCGGCPGHCRMFSSISGLYPLDANMPTTKNVSEHCFLSSGNRNHPWLRTTAPGDKLRSGSGGLGCATFRFRTGTVLGKLGWLYPPLPSLVWILKFSHSGISDSLRSHQLQHFRPPCPSPTPRVHLNPSLLSQWCHPTISSSVVPFSSCPQSFPASGSFQMSQLFAWGGQSIGVSASMNTQWIPRPDLL